MPKMDDKVLKIGYAITLQAEAESKKIIQEANEIRDREISRYRDQVIDEMFGRIQNETRCIRERTLREKAVAVSNAYRELLRRREELSAGVFQAVRDRLEEYTGTEEYRASMLKHLSEVKEQWDHNSSVVMLRPADMALEDRIKAALPGCEVRATRQIRLGGFRLRNTQAGILLDETLDSRLEDQRSWYLQNCGLKTS